ncbi:MAG: protein phosphatase 2C domain-containing protein [Bacilli bacterium]|nr:protein phosphatase 2C domain-containing protein [Bacilli bacterium]
MAKQTIKGQFGAKTDIGKIRVSNEDQAFALINASGNVLLGVCDGMGGHNKGDYASRLAMEIITEEFRERSGFRSSFSLRMWINRLVKKVNSRIYKEAYSNTAYKDMGTTLVMAILYGELIFVVNIGDSRAYQVRFNDLKKMTEDQTYVDYLYRTGKISEQEAQTSDQRHILMNALGAFPSASFQIKVYQNLKNPILLCSDGLYNNATEAEIHSALRTNERIEQKIDTLLAIGNSNGGSDNMAVAYWEAIDND